jgi:hypothetical protein
MIRFELTPATNQRLASSRKATMAWHRGVLYNSFGRDLPLSGSEVIALNRPKFRAFRQTGSKE